MAKAIRALTQGQTLFDGDSIAAGYYLFQYQAGTTTKANTYTDSGKGTANSNPMTLNSDGRLDQDVYIDQSMKFVLAASTAGDPPSSSVWTIDSVLSTEQLEDTVSKTTNYTVLETDRDKTILVDASSGAVTITLVAAATAGDGFRLAIKKTDSGANAVTIDGNSSETIDGSTTHLLNNQYDAVDLICDGANWHIKATEVSGVISASGATVEIDRDLTITSGDLTVSQGSISQIDEDSRTNSVAYPLILDVQTDGTPAAGIGTGIEFRAESADETNSPFGRLNFVSTDVTSGSEDTYLSVQTRVGGAALAEMFAFKNTGGFAFTFEGSPSAARTITLPDEDVTLSAGSLIPPGTILAYGAAAAPSGYLACDGSAVSRTTYADLFAVVSTTWGNGDGSTTFNVPDLRGRAPIGQGTGSGLTARTIADEVGAETHQLTVAELPSHDHPTVANTAGGSGLSGSGSIGTGNTGTRGGNQPHNNMQPSTVVAFIIKT